MTARRKRTVKILFSLLLTKKEANAIAYAVGNSIGDPDWWKSHGKGDHDATYRALHKITLQTQAREPDFMPLYPSRSKV